MNNEESVRLSMKFARDMIIYSVETDKCLTKRVLKEVLLETNRYDIRNVIHLFREVDGELVS